MKLRMIKIILLSVMIATPLSGCSSCERMGKDIQSDIGGVVKFDLNGQRIMYYNCYVEVIEKLIK